MNEWMCECCTDGRLNSLVAEQIARKVIRILNPEMFEELNELKFVTLQFETYSQ